MEIICFEYTEHMHLFVAKIFTGVNDGILSNTPIKIQWFLWTPGIHIFIYFFSCLCCPWQRLGKDQQWCQQWCMSVGVWGDDLSRGAVPEDSYHTQPALAVMTFSHALHICTGNWSCPDPRKLCLLILLKRHKSHSRWQSDMHSSSHNTLSNTTKQGERENSDDNPGWR